MIKQFHIGKSSVSIVGKTATEIDEKFEAYKKKKGYSQDDKTGKRKRRTKAEIEADEAQAAAKEE